MSRKDFDIALSEVNVPNNLYHYQETALLWAKRHIEHLELLNNSLFEDLKGEQDAEHVSLQEFKEEYVINI